MDEIKAPEVQVTPEYNHSEGLKRGAMIVALWVAGKITAYVTASPLLAIVNKIHPVSQDQINTYVTGAVLMGLAYGHHYLKERYPKLP